MTSQIIDLTNSVPEVIDLTNCSQIETVDVFSSDSEDEVATTSTKAPQQDDDVEMESLTSALRSMNLEYIKHVERAMYNADDIDLTIVKTSLEEMMEKLKKCHDQCVQANNLNHAQKVFIEWAKPKNIHTRYGYLFINKIKKLDYSAPYMKGMFTKMHKQYLKDGYTFPWDNFPVSQPQQPQQPEEDL